MKSFVLCVLMCLALAAADTVLHPRGCIYINGRCYKECPIGTHAYALGCGKKTPEPTCKQPNPVQEEHDLCDYSACYCDAPTIRDEKTNKCVRKEECSPQDPIKASGITVTVEPPKTTLQPPFEEPKAPAEKPQPESEKPQPESEKPAEKKE